MTSVFLDFSYNTGYYLRDIKVWKQHLTFFGLYYIFFGSCLEGKSPSYGLFWLKRSSDRRSEDYKPATGSETQDLEQGVQKGNQAAAAGYGKLSAVFTNYN